MSGFEPVLHVGSVKPHAFHLAQALAHGHLKDGHAPGTQQSHAAHFADQAGHFARDQFLDGLRAQAILVAEGQVVEQVFNGCDALFLQRLGDAGPMPLTNCSDVSRVSSTSEMLSVGGARVRGAVAPAPCRLKQQRERGSLGPSGQGNPGGSAARPTVDVPPKAHSLSQPGRKDRISGTPWQQCRAAASGKQRPACRRTWRPYARPFGKPYRVYPSRDGLLPHRSSRDSHAKTEQFCVYS